MTRIIWRLISTKEFGFENTRHLHVPRVLLTAVGWSMEYRRDLSFEETYHDRRRTSGNSIQKKLWTLHTLTHPVQTDLERASFSKIIKAMSLD